jgi:xylan 1,4-beta-xylosidase
MADLGCSDPGINIQLFCLQLFDKLGKTELTNADSRSWASKDVMVVSNCFSGISQHPPGGLYTTKYYIQDLPAKRREVNSKSVPRPSGKYTLEIYKVGYRVMMRYSYLTWAGPPS